LHRLHDGQPPRVRDIPNYATPGRHGINVGVSSPGSDAMSSTTTQQRPSRARAQASTASGMITSAGLAVGLLGLWVLIGTVI
jgi:hypothetical protein